MKHRESTRHPGVMRTAPVDSEWAGIFVAIGFVLMGLVSVPIAMWFVLGALPLGVIVALLMRWMRREKPLQSIGLGEPPATLTTAENTTPGRTTSSVDVSERRLSALPA